MVAELHAAVQGVLRAGGELGGGGVEVVPHAPFAQRGQRGESAFGQHQPKKGRARRVELEDREHG